MHYDTTTYGKVIVFIFNFFELYDSKEYRCSYTCPAIRFIIATLLSYSSWIKRLRSKPGYVNTVSMLTEFLDFEWSANICYSLATLIYRYIVIVSDLSKVCLCAYHGTESMVSIDVPSLSAIPDWYVSLHGNFYSALLANNYAAIYSFRFLLHCASSVSY